MSQPEPTLRDQLVAALGEVRLNLGPNALAMVQRGETIRLSGNEKDTVADVAAAVAQGRLDAKDTEIVRLNTELAGWQLHYDPPPRPVVSTADISDYEEQP